MKRYYNILIFTLIVHYSYSQDTTHQFKINYYNQKVMRYLDKERALSGHYTINKDGIAIYASTQDKINNKTEFFLKWELLENFKKCSATWDSKTKLKKYKEVFYQASFDCSFQDALKVIPSQNSSTSKAGILKGYKIAIDAGHTAGDFEHGVTEMKYLNFKKDSIHELTDSIQIAEGMLTFATAQLLKEKLEADGANVFVTRKENGYTAFNKTFDQWLKDDYKKTIDSLFNAGKFNSEKKNWYLNQKRTRREKFTLIFKNLELAKRAEIINDFHPDFTLITHYNVDETNTGWTKPGTRNFNMTFIGGAFMGNDLSSPEKRFEFLRMIISNDIEQSVKLSAAVINNFEKILNVKTAGPTDAKYLREGCLATSEKGVYCRNLQLTRYIHGPLVYGETLYQDNINECKSLNKECDKTKNERVQQVAEAYYQGVLKYTSSLLLNKQ